MKTISYKNIKRTNSIKYVHLIILQIFLLMFIAFNAISQHISVDAGSLVLSNNIVISGSLHLNNNGNFICRSGSKVTFRGNHQQEVKGVGSFAFFHLEINNSSYGVELKKDIIVYGQITLTDGDLDLLDNTLTMRSNSTIVGEDQGSRIISSTGNSGYTPGQDAGDGQVIKTVDISTSGVTNVGGLGISITPTANFGSTTVVRKHQRAVGCSGDNSVFRSYTITPTNSANLEAQVVFNYNGIEMNGNSSGNLKLYQKKTGSKNSKGVEWEEISSSDNGSSVSATTNDNNQSEIELTAAGTNKVLPVSLLSFDAICMDNTVLLKWKTASEKNNDYFIIERSNDGIGFEEIGTIQGAGNSNAIKNYDLIDANNSNTLVYYRLTQVDFDGKYMVFDIISSDCSNSKPISFKYVNPVNNKQLTILSSQISKDNITLCIYSNTGQCVLIKKLKNGVNSWNINVDILSQGIYQVVLKNHAIYESKPVIII